LCCCDLEVSGRRGRRRGWRRDEEEQDRRVEEEEGLKEEGWRRTMRKQGTNLLFPTPSSPTNHQLEQDVITHFATTTTQQHHNKNTTQVSSLFWGEAVCR